MVQHMVDNFGGCRFVNCGTAMATGEKQQSISAQKSALHDLPNETKNNMIKSSGNSPLQKERAPVPAAINKVSTTLKQQTCYHVSPARPQQLGGNGINGHLVYVRRKLETDPGKINNNGSNSRKHETESVPINGSSSDSPAAKRYRNDCTSEPKQHSDLAPEASASPLQVPTEVPAAPLNISFPGSAPSSSNEKFINGLPVGASNCSSIPSASLGHPAPQRIPAAVSVQPDTQTIHTRISFQSEPQRPRDQHWKERFGHLQMYLKSCDQSNQEEYIQKLRSLSAAGRSKHAYELEWRAIQLTLKEGTELQKVRILNVLGKAWPDRHASPLPAQIHSPAEVVTNNHQVVSAEKL